MVPMPDADATPPSSDAPGTGETKADDFVREAVLRIMDRIQKAIDFDASVNGLATGLEVFDRWTNGLHPGELTLIAGAAGTGKTSMAVRLVETVACGGASPISVGWVTLRESSTGHC